MSDTTIPDDQSPSLPDIKSDDQPATSKQQLPRVELMPLTFATKSCTSAGLLLISIIPTIGLWQWDQSFRSSQRTDPSTLIWTYVFAGTIGMAIAIALQGILAYSFALLLFRSEATDYLVESAKTEYDIKDEEHRLKRLKMSRRWEYWVFMAVFTFIPAGLVEEGLKYSIIMGAQRYGTIKHDHDYVLVAIAAALGFATVENIAYVQGALSKNEKPSRLALTVIERMIFGLPGHSMTAALIAVNMLDKSNTLWQILRDPLLFHGVFDFMLFAISAYNGNVGWVHPRDGFTIFLALGLAVAIQSSLAGLLIQKLQLAGVFF